MIRKKVCMLGAFAVGKTSLVRRFVESLFSDEYLTTVGVKIDKKQLEVDGHMVSMILWDLQGEDELQSVRTSYLRGSAAYLLICDGTRPSTLDTAFDLHERAREAAGDVPFLLLVNKSDLEERWELEEAVLESLRARGWTTYTTSAKSGEGVEEAFHALARRLIDAH